MVGGIFVSLVLPDRAFWRRAELDERSIGTKDRNFRSAPAAAISRLHLNGHEIASIPAPKFDTEKRLPELRFPAQAGRMKRSRFLFSVLGSYGDLHPVIGIGLELMRRGHQVTIASNDVYRERIEQLGFEFVLIKPGLADIGPESEWIDRATDFRRGTEYVVRDIVVPWVGENYRALEGPARDHDVLVSHTLSFALPILARKLGKSWVSLALQPIVFFSAVDPPVLAQAPWLASLRAVLPVVFHRLLFQIARIHSFRWLKPVAQLHVEAGLGPMQSNPLFEGQFSPEMTLALFSEKIAAPQKDWPRGVVVTGFPLYDRESSAEASMELTKFLERGEAPLVFTLGSSAVMNAGVFYREAASVALSLNRRAVLLVGRDPRNRDGLPADQRILVRDYEPFSQVFPHASVIVHQGGIGTLGQALYAGRPQLIVPFSHDQPDNAARMERLGVGLSLPRKNFDGNALRKKLQRLLAEPGFGEKSERVGQGLREENDGIVRAADCLESVASNSKS
jgi:rhamnosyltransferase subunit B